MGWVGLVWVVSGCVVLVWFGVVWFGVGYNEKRCTPNPVPVLSKPGTRALETTYHLPQAWKNVPSILTVFKNYLDFKHLWFIPLFCQISGRSTWFRGYRYMVLSLGYGVYGFERTGYLVSRIRATLFWG